ncbi:hypothetical protein [Pedobacter sp. MW01-1-1]|uniref:hypothetical protein n=1 Tax=Pedobacter sp. MW01-1-1 TaxID=3383027 RepID=UPI003FED7D70
MESKDIRKGDRNKIYFLVLVIAALVGMNVYLIFKNRQQSSRFVSVNTEKDKLHLEVEKIEVELDKVNALNLDLNENLRKEQEEARIEINRLKAELKKNTLTVAELEKAKEKIKRLQSFVKRYNEEIIQLQQENLVLRIGRDSLENTVKSIKNKAADLENENVSLNSKIKKAARLKIEKASVLAFRTKSNGRPSEVTRSSTAEKLSVRFTIIPNSIAEKGLHNIYLRVFDPAGNLILANEESRFEAEGQTMQFSHSIFINYNDDESTYIIDWTNPQPFIKGIYTVILYADGASIGKAQIELK